MRYFVLTLCVLLICGCANTSQKKSEKDKDGECKTLQESAVDSIAQKHIADSIYWAKRWAEEDSIVNIFVSKFKMRIKNHDVNYLKKHVYYPLEIGYFTVHNEEEFVRYYDKIFDERITRMIEHSSGCFWLSYDRIAIYEEGKNYVYMLFDWRQDSILYLNAESEYVKKENKRLYNKDMATLPKKLRDVSVCVLKFNTTHYKARIDRVLNPPSTASPDSIRLTMWKHGRSTLEKPDVCLYGIEQIEGSARNGILVFPDEGYMWTDTIINAYIVYVDNGESEATFSYDYNLPITKDDKYGYTFGLSDSTAMFEEVTDISPVMK